MYQYTIPYHSIYKIQPIIVSDAFVFDLFFVPSRKRLPFVLYSPNLWTHTNVAFSIMFVCVCHWFVYHFNVISKIIAVSVLNYSFELMFAFFFSWKFGAHHSNVKIIVIVHEKRLKYMPIRSSEKKAQYLLHFNQCDRENNPENWNKISRHGRLAASGDTQILSIACQCSYQTLSLSSFQRIVNSKSTEKSWQKYCELE